MFSQVVSATRRTLKVSQSSQSRLPQTLLAQYSIKSPLPLPSVLFEDDDYIFVYKNPGIPSMSAEDSLHQKMRELLGSKDFQPGMLKPVERQASGVMVFGKNKPAEAHFLKVLREGKVSDGILVGSYGNLAFPKSGKINSTIIRTPSNMSKFSIVRYGGKPIQLQYSVLSQFTLQSPPPVPAPPEKKRKAEKKVEVASPSGNGYIIAFNNITEQEHQVRSACAALQVPIVGDTVYGGREHPSLLYHSAFLKFRKVDKEGEKPEDFYKVWKKPEGWLKEFEENIKEEEVWKTWLVFERDQLEEVATWKKHGST